LISWTYSLQSSALYVPKKSNWFIIIIIIIMIIICFS
jgi:hypothetical protein